MTDLCREFGISRKTGYKFRDRFSRNGIVGLHDQSKAPGRTPHRTQDAIVELLVAMRRRHTTWGPKKIKSRLEEKHPGLKIPAVSTIAEILDRHGLVQRRKRRQRRERFLDVLTSAGAPNDLWCIDFKGQFRLGNGRYCYPLTITDQFSRYLLCCEGFDRIDGALVRETMTDVFREHGLPDGIRSDNGTPFASTGLLRLSRLSVWWMRLGIKPERIEPGEPQQNGRHERMHLTLKQETTRPAAANLLQQQERFDLFDHSFNHQRPHEALGQTPPARHFKPSERLFPSPLPLPQYPLHDVIRRVARCGHVGVVGGKTEFFLSTALAGQTVGLRELGEGCWLVTFMDLDLGLYDRPSRQFMPADHPSFEEEFKKINPDGDETGVSPMLPD